MDPSHSRSPAAAGDSDADDESSLSGIFVSEIFVSDRAWRRHVRHAEATARRAARIAGTGADIVLASDRDVQRLNARDRGRNKPTNVLTYPAPAPHMPGEIILALGTVLREARAAGRRPAHHLAHLIVHGALHLAGHDHHHPGEARRMERAEARLLHRMRVLNPWRHA